MFTFDFSFIEPKNVLTIFHLLGLSLGLGGALIADLLFFHASRDRKITKTEFRFLIAGSHAVTAGLIILILSGASMFFLDVERFLDSTKFLAKVTIVGILVVNGVLLHTVHIPHMRKTLGRALFDSVHPGYPLFFLASGVVSIVSWISAMILGSLSVVPWSYGGIISFYAIVLFCSLLLAFILRESVIPSGRIKR